MDLKSIKEQAEAELAEEQAKAAKEKIKALLRKKSAAQLVLANIDREISDCYAELGKGISTELSS